MHYVTNYVMHWHMRWKYVPSPLLIWCSKYHLHERGDWCRLLSCNEVVCTSPTTVKLHTQCMMLMELEIWMIPNMDDAIAKLDVMVVVSIPSVGGVFNITSGIANGLYCPSLSFFLLQSQLSVSNIFAPNMRPGQNSYQIRR